MLNQTKYTNLIFGGNEEKYKRFYLGKVKENRDPENLLRVKVEIPELTKGIDKKYLPWYLVEQPINGSLNSCAVIPPINEDVIVEFPNNDIYNGLVKWKISSKPPKLK